MPIFSRPEAKGNGEKPAPQKTRFAPSRFSHAWARIIEHLTPPSHPSTTSESGIESSFNNTDLFYAESVEPSNNSHPLDLLNPRSATTSKHKKTTTVTDRLVRSRTRQKSSVANSTSRYGDDEDTFVSSDPVSHVVVENDFEQYIPVVARSDSGSTNRTPGLSTQNAIESSGAGIVSKENGDEDGPPKTRSDAGSIRRDMRGNWIRRTVVYELLVDRAWPNFKHFLDSSFPEATKERSFQKEVR
jgi:hypothetical protein